jgi:hypothetical protein
MSLMFFSCRTNWGFKLFKDGDNKVSKKNAKKQQIQR